MSETSEKTHSMAATKPIPHTNANATRKKQPGTADRSTPENLSQLARKHPALLIGGGIALGVIVSALLPRGMGRRLARGAIATAALGGEASLALARQAREGARHAAEETSDRLRSLEEKAGEGARKLRVTTSEAAGSAASTGHELARAGLRLLSSLRR